MALISEVLVENFRSIKTVHIRDLSDYEPLLGLNSAGKSNFLRALKLFFSGTVDEFDSPLSLNRDYSDYGRSKGKQISVGVRFTLNGPVRFPRQQSFVEAQGLLEGLAIKQTWQMNSQSNTLVRRFHFGPDFDSLNEANPTDVQTLESFIKAINFRYIPNHARPTDLMREHIDPLREVLVSRLGRTREYQESDASELLSALERTTEVLFAPASKGIQGGLADVTLKASLPRNFNELVFDLAIQSIDTAGLARAPELEGSGAQSFMLLHLLALADSTAVSASFGWIQGSIWAIEQPESFLHSGLRLRFAQDLTQYATQDRRQVFLTTHQDEFVTVGSSAVLATKNQDGTSLKRLNARDAMKQSNQSGISAFLHPLVRDRDRPLVIVEGRYDAKYLREAIRRSQRIRPRWRIVSPDDMLEMGTSGDALKQYLKYNASALASRPLEAPVLVVRDWETKDISSYTRVLDPHTPSSAKIAPVEHCCPDLGKSFVGIERFLTRDFIQSLIPPAELMTAGDGTLEIKREVLEQHKAALAAAVGEFDDDLPHLELLLNWVNEEVENMLITVPGSEFA